MTLLLLIIILLPDCYRTWRYSRSPRRRPLWKRALRWLPSLLMTAFLLCTFFLKQPAISMQRSTYILQMLLGFYFVPRFLLRLCVAVGRMCRPLSRKRRNWGRPIGLLAALAAVGIFVYGTFVGPRRLVVKHIEMTFSNLPENFDGYRLAVASDLHLGTQGKAFVQRIVQTINEQQPDAVCLLGDLQNADPQEIYPYTTLLRSLHSRDGVFSVLGNHDYSYYSATTDDAIRAANERETIARQRQAGWTLLLNEHRSIEHNGQRIYIAGTEFYADHNRQMVVDIPDKAAPDKALDGIPKGAFTILLQHNPAEWRAQVAGRYDPALTLSGHTHGGQMQLFGLRPSAYVYSEDYGLYTQGHQRLYVTGGLGGLFRFRFNMPPEIIIITLKSVDA